MRYHHARRRANVTASQKVVSAMKIRLKVGATPLNATLLESKASRDFASLLPLTLTMNDLFRREKYGHLPRPISEEGRRAHTYEVGQIAYWAPGPDVAIYYRLPDLPRRIPDVLRPSGARRWCASGAAARPARGRHPGRHPRASAGRPHPEPADALGRHGHGLVCRGRRQRQAGRDGRGRRRRRGGSSRGPLRETDGRRADHRDEPSRAPTETRTRVRRDRHRRRAG